MISANQARDYQQQVTEAAIEADRLRRQERAIYLQRWLIDNYQIITDYLADADRLIHAAISAGRATVTLWIATCPEQDCVVGELSDKLGSLGYKMRIGDRDLNPDTWHFRGAESKDYRYYIEISWALNSPFPDA